MKTLATITAAALGLAAAPAAAQAIVDTPSGPRIELRAGWDRIDIVSELQGGSQRYEEGMGDSGVTYGTEVGYDFATGASIVGIYAGISGASLKTCENFYAGATLVSRDCLTPGRDVTVGARVGFVTGPNSLIYLKGGYSNGQVKRDYSDTFNPADSGRDTNSLDGFHVGAGGEVGMGRHAYGKLEYVYSNYAGSTTEIGGFRVESGVERHNVVAGVGYRF